MKVLHYTYNKTMLKWWVCFFNHKYLLKWWGLSHLLHILHKLTFLSRYYKYNRLALKWIICHFPSKWFIILNTRNRTYIFKHFALKSNKDNMALITKMRICERPSLTKNSYRMLIIGLRSCGILVMAIWP